MAKQRSAGDLFHRYAFDKRVEVDRGDGVTVGKWQEQFQCRAGVINLRGGEAVMAGRLQGQHSQIVFIRSSTAAKLATTEWRARDVRSGDIVINASGDMVDGMGWTGISYNIREITLNDDRMWLDFLCQSGVAVG